ncbi:hypothetical protein INS49_015608 [Diaporthe citri]|uniref:uncharacterized protein n=1 Tax=Diaporthe citri TaxID=83186 RepID=UPI001C824F3D|nr:uncharacterized protein INS49_015608 [Diaporthe citri]KAG6356221.1 hypothetical protein INS49_015608 [Diaporthe citri]
MSIQFPRRRWAESGDWDSVRSLITMMYKVEGRPLKEVMRIMETEHQFLATPKMYKKRIKDWGIDKNLKTDKLLASPRTQQRRDATQKGSQSGVRGTVVDAPNTNQYVEACSGFPQQFQHGSPPSAGEAMQREYHTPASMLPSQQPNDNQQWATAGRFHGDGSYSPWFSQSGQPSEKARTTVLGSIQDRFLEASDAITRQDTAELFAILNPAYEAISSVSETEATQLVAVVVELFQLLYRRPNHQDMLRQLLQYVFALVPDAVRQNQFLSFNSQVLNLLGRPCHRPPLGVPLDTAGGTDSRPTVSGHDYDYYEQHSGASPTFDNRFGGTRRHPY